MKKQDVLAIFSMGEQVFRTRGLNENEKSLLVNTFNSLDVETDFDTRLHIVNGYSDLFNSIME